MCQPSEHTLQIQVCVAVFSEQRELLNLMLNNVIVWPVIIIFITFSHYSFLILCSLYNYSHTAPESPGRTRFPFLIKRQVPLEISSPLVGFFFFSTPGLFIKDLNLYVHPHFWIALRQIYAYSKRRYANQPYLLTCFCLVVIYGRGKSFQQQLFARTQK